jgi:biotin-(acetyl-CoA carboxylase) ligase
LRAEYEERSVLSGENVRVTDGRGDEHVAGSVLGIDSEGRLLVDGPDGVTAVAAGDVTLARKRT